MRRNDRELFLGPKRNSVTWSFLNILCRGSYKTLTFNEPVYCVYDSCGNAIPPGLAVHLQNRKGEDLYFEQGCFKSKGGLKQTPKGEYAGINPSILRPDEERNIGIVNIEYQS